MWGGCIIREQIVWSYFYIHAIRRPRASIERLNTWRTWQARSSATLGESGQHRPLFCQLDFAEASSTLAEDVRLGFSVSPRPFLSLHRPGKPKISRDNGETTDASFKAADFLRGHRAKSSLSTKKVHSRCQERRSRMELTLPRKASGHRIKRVWVELIRTRRQKNVQIARKPNWEYKRTKVHFFLNVRSICLFL